MHAGQVPVVEPEGGSHLNIPIDHQGLISRLQPTLGPEPANLDSDNQDSSPELLKCDPDTSYASLAHIGPSLVIPKPDPDNIDPNPDLDTVNQETGIHPDTLRALVEQLRAASPAENVEQIIIIETQ